MKNAMKVTLAVIVLLIATFVKGQNEIQVAVSEMKENTATMQFVLRNIDENLKKDKHKELEKNIHAFEALLNKLQEAASPFKDEYRSEIDSRCSSLATNILQFEKTVHASKFFDKHKELNVAIVELNSNTDKLREYIDELDALVDEISGTTIIVVSNDDPVRDNPQAPVVLQPGQSDDAQSLKNKCDAIEIQLDGIANAFKYNKYDDIGKYCSRISDLCDELNDLTTDGKLSEIAQDMKQATHDLEHLSLQGHSKHDLTHHEYDHLKKLYSKLDYQVAALD